ncbi:MAG: signal peptidase I [Gammaproteobacteria bacterium]|nr:signal peptidase I [Gammaproteobacteria bacterium]
MSNLVIAFDVPSVLTALVFISGIIALLDILVFSKKRPKDKKIPLWSEYARSFFPIFLLVLCIRSFLIQPYRVPTGSLAPTVLPGDFIVVNQYAYGLRLPVLNAKVLNIREPKRGDIALFRYPGDLNKLYVKRVIGLPGDHIVYRNKTLSINGDVAWQTPFGMALDTDGNGFVTPVQVKIENLGKVVHKIFVKSGYKEWENIDIVVPPASYFMMGDNRDNSEDGRSWGFVPEANLVGKAFATWMSWDSEKNSVRWKRIGKSLY